MSLLVKFKALKGAYITDVIENQLASRIEIQAEEISFHSNRSFDTIFHNCQQGTFCEFGSGLSIVASGIAKAFSLNPAEFNKADPNSYAWDIVFDTEDGDKKAEVKMFNNSRNGDYFEFNIFPLGAKRTPGIDATTFVNKGIKFTDFLILCDWIDLDEKPDVNAPSNAHWKIIPRFVVDAKFFKEYIQPISGQPHRYRVNLDIMSEYNHAIRILP